MRTRTNNELKIIIANHLKWLNNKDCVEYADLRYADLSYADLSHANLSYVDLRGEERQYMPLMLYTRKARVEG